MLSSESVDGSAVIYGQLAKLLASLNGGAGSVGCGALSDEVGRGTYQTRLQDRV